MLSFPATTNQTWTWAGMAFLIGIALHSLAPYQSYSFFLLGVLVAVGLALFLVCKKLSLPWMAGILLFCAVLGMWRFELARPGLPAKLKPLDPKGFAYHQTKSLPSSFAWLETGRKTLTQRAKDIFPPDEAALLTGILYGERSMTPVLNQRFRQAGLLHIVAVSGSNVTILVVLLMPLLLCFGFGRRKTFFLLSIALILFVLFVRPSASVVRAALMGWLVEFAPLVGRIPRPSRLLLIAAIVFTLWQPWALFYDVSFALSFLAMWGLLTWSAWFQEKLSPLIRWSGVREIISATLGATLMTIPYTAWAFGQLSLFGLVTSFIALPLIPWSMALGALALIIPIPIFTFPAQGFLDTILFAARLPEFIPFGFWKNISLPVWTMLGLYLFILWGWNELQRSKNLQACPK